MMKKSIRTQIIDEVTSLRNAAQKEHEDGKDDLNDLVRDLNEQLEILATAGIPAHLLKIAYSTPVVCARQIFTTA